MPLGNRLAMKICDRNTPGPCQQPEWKYRHLRTPCLLINRELATETHRLQHAYKPTCLRPAPVMEGHHEVRKSLSLWHLSKKWVVSLVNILRPKCFFSTWGENGPWWTRQAGGKVWYHFGVEKGQRHELRAISHPVAWSKLPIFEVLPDL